MTVKVCFEKEIYSVLRGENAGKELPCDEDHEHYSYDWEEDVPRRIEKVEPQKKVRAKP